MKTPSLSLLSTVSLVVFGFLVYAMNLPERNTEIQSFEKLNDDTLRLSPTVLVQSDTDSSYALLLNECYINVKAVGGLAETELTLVYENRSNRVLEGTFYFPLQEGQFITDFQLETDGGFNPGVIVEKEQGRVAFEATIRKKIDPALLEWAQGNNFKTRVYPIPAKGKKTIKISFAQVLKKTDEGLAFDLPLQFKDRMKKFEVHGRFDGTENVEYQTVSNPYPGKMEAVSGGYEFHSVSEDIYANQPLHFELSLKTKNPSSSLALGSGESIVLSHIELDNIERPKKLPSELTLVWDVSSSSEKRDFEREKVVLSEYFKALGNATVHIVTFSNEVHSRETISLTPNYNASMLFNRLQQLPMDGATQLGCLKQEELKGEEILLFSDCLSNFGSDNLRIPSGKRVIVLTSSFSADPSTAKRLTQLNGDYIPLLEMSTSDALSRLKTERIRYLGIEGVDKELTPGIGQPYTKGFVACAKLPAGMSKATYLFGFGKEITKRLEVSPNAISSNEGSELMERFWAHQKIEDLDVDPQRNEPAILALGLKYNLISRFTSLIILESAADYARHNINPPASMKKEFDRILAEEKKATSDADEVHEKNVLASFLALQKWYTATYTPKGGKFQNAEFSGEVESDSISDMQVSDQTVRGQRNRESNATLNFVPPTVQEFTNALSADEAEKKEDGNSSNKASIALEAWNPETPYMEEIRKVAKEQAYETYLKLKRTFGAQPSFYLDVADYFIEIGDKSKALRILTNIAEMELENPQLLRVLAHRLEQMDELDYSISVFENVKELRAEEPQSYRDLALVCERKGDYNRAAKELLYVIEHRWDERFRDVEAISLVELNHLLVMHPEVKSAATIAEKYVYQMPVDTRVILTWDTDNCDIDLWVTDPRGEKCYYSHTLTELGARISQDCVAGYGPEEFMLKTAIKGEYKVQANYYGSSATSITGPTTIQLKLITNYGKPNEKVQSITRRLESQKEVIDLGTFLFE